MNSFGTLTTHVLTWDNNLEAALTGNQDMTQAAEAMPPRALQSAALADLLPRTLALLHSMAELTSSRSEHAEILSVIAGLEQRKE